MRIKEAGDAMTEEAQASDVQLNRELGAMPSLENRIPNSEDKHMQVKASRIRSNLFRNEDELSIDERTVEELVASIEETRGLWSPLLGSV